MFVSEGCEMNDLVLITFFLNVHHLELDVFTPLNPKNLLI